MSPLTRRKLLQTALLGGASAACDWKPRNERQLVLEGLVRRVALPDTRAILERSHELATALRALQAEPSAVRLIAARAALRGAILAWQRAYAFRNGPIIETSAYLRSAFWPIRAQPLHELVERSAPSAISAELVDELGVDVKGVFAIEELLSGGASAEDEQALIQHTRAHAFAAALADDVARRADAAQKLLGDGAQFASRFASAGQASINLLVNQMIATLEMLAARRLEHVVTMHDNHNLRIVEVQGGKLGLSSAIPLGWLRTTEALYQAESGEGLKQLLAQAAPALEPSVSSAFASARAALARLHSPLEQLVAIDRGAIVAAVKAVKALEIALRVELSSALGVTLTFVASDGD